MLPITADEAGSGLVPPAVATHLMGDTGSALILIMLFMAIVSTGSAESIAVSSLVSYDIYREYMNPEATGEQILFVSRVVIVVYGLFMGALAILLDFMGKSSFAHSYNCTARSLWFLTRSMLHSSISTTSGLNLGWVYLFMGIMIGSAVIPLWNLMTWEKASGTGAIISAWSGLILALIGWIVGAQVQSGSVSVATLGTNEVMLSGNLIAILSSGLIHYVYSKFIDPQDFDFATLDDKITLVEEDKRGLSEEEQDKVMLRRAERWIKRRGYILTFILIIAWPILSVPAGVFSKSYFSLWVLIAIAWGFGAAITITFLPLIESAEDINTALSGIFYMITCRQAPQATEPGLEEQEAKAVQEDSDEGPEAPVETESKEVNA